jgi:ABC-2 type transport system permease protein
LTPDWAGALWPGVTSTPPMRHFTLEHLSLSDAERERLVPVLTWFGWEVPVGVQLLSVAVITLGLVTLAARVFRTTE